MVSRPEGNVLLLTDSPTHKLTAPHGNWDPGLESSEPPPPNFAPGLCPTVQAADLNPAKRELPLDLLRAPPIRQIMITISFFSPKSWINQIGPLPHRWVGDRMRETAQARFFFPSGKLMPKRIWWEKWGFYLCHLKKNVSLQSAVEAITSRHTGEQTYWQVQSGNQRWRETFLLAVESSDFLPEAKESSAWQRENVERLKIMKESSILAAWKTRSKTCLHKVTLFKIKSERLKLVN